MLSRFIHLNVLSTLRTPARTIAPMSRSTPPRHAGRYSTRYTRSAIRFLSAPRRWDLRC